MPLDPNEAVARMNRDPINVDPEARETLIATHGEQKYREMRNTAARAQAENIRVTSARPSMTRPAVVVADTTSTTMRQFDGHQRGAQPRPAAAAPAPAPVLHDPNNPNHDQAWEQSLTRAEAALTSNPVFISPADKALLISRWGKAEYQRRRGYAIQAGGFDNMKVTVR